MDKEPWKTCEICKNIPEFYSFDPDEEKEPEIYSKLKTDENKADDHIRECPVCTTKYRFTWETQMSFANWNEGMTRKVRIERRHHR